MTGRQRVVLALGSNQGNRLGTLQGCVYAIGQLPDTDVLAISPVYQTAPVGGPAQPDYLNAVLIAATALPPRELLAAVNRIEADFGRVRAERFGPRTLDVDIISYAAAAATTRCSPCRIPGRTSARSCSPPGTTSTPGPNCPGTDPSPTCWPASTAAASTSSPTRSWRRRPGQPPRCHEADPYLHAGPRGRRLRAGRLAAAAVDL